MPASSTALVSSSTNSGLPIGLDDDLFRNLGGQWAAAGHPRDHAFDVGAVEAAERQGGDIGQADPRRFELRPEGEQR
jgi:hypothetical protein